MSNLDLNRVGFAGLGIMGAPMSRRLLDQGRSLVVWNRSAEKADALAEEYDGVEVVSAPADLAGCDVVLGMMLHTAACERLLLGDDGLLTADRPPKVLVNMATIDPRSSVRFREACLERGCEYLAAPVSGSTMFAREGKLTIITSGSPDTFDAVRPLLADAGQQVLHVGEGVEAHLLKLAVNMVIGAYSSAMYEAITLCLKGGVDEGAYLNILNESVIGTPFSRYKTAGLVAHDYTPGHTVRGLDKDFELIELTARSLGAAIPVTSLVRQQIRAGVGRGEGHLDMTALLKQYLRDAGLAEVADHEPAIATA